ncbi:MAG: sugar phosphate isomerase/epimerase [Armatimonadetes bacterium]|nr:sugar phosphate isomerase/epimerase [Armatimonadota bacterium]
MFEACVFTDEVAPEFPEAVRLAAEAGARMLEIRGKLFGQNIRELSPETVNKIRSVCEAHQVGIGSLGSPVGKCSMDDPDEMEQHGRIFERMLDLSEELDCPIIRGFALWAPNHGKDWVRDLNPYLDRIAEFLMPKAEQAAERGAVLALENEWDTLMGSCAEARRIVQHLGEPEGLGLVWDFGNSVILGESPYPEGYELIVPWLVHVHVKPNPNGTASPLPGTDDVTLGEVLSRLWNDDYEGCISVEHFPGPEKTLQAVRDVVMSIQEIEAASRRARD